MQGRNSTPLHLAAGYNHLRTCEVLLEKGADVNVSDRGGLIPLHNAASYGHTEVSGREYVYVSWHDGKQASVLFVECAISHHTCCMRLTRIMASGKASKRFVITNTSAAYHTTL